MYRPLPRRLHRPLQQLPPLPLPPLHPLSPLPLQRLPPRLPSFLPVNGRPTNSRNLKQLCGTPLAFVAISPFVDVTIFMYVCCERSKYPKTVDKRWDLIGAAVKGKTKAECIARFKQIQQQILMKTKK
jgi:hypothetical protein